MKTFVQIGCGGWGRQWIQQFIPEVSDVARCVAAVDISRDALLEARQMLHLPATACYTDVREALRAHKVDFAVVAVSIPAHLPVIRTIVEAQPGCHILSEKPVAGCRGDCLEIERLTNEAGIKCAFTFSHRYERDKQTFEQVLHSGKYGKINTLVARLIMHKHWVIEPPENILIDGGVHYLDMLRAFTGSEGKRVYAQAWNCPWPRGGNAASAFVQVEMVSGVRACLEYELGGAEDRNGWCNEYFRAECERASLVLDRQRITACWTDDVGRPWEEGVQLLSGEHWKHDLIIRNYITWLDGGFTPDICLAESQKSMALMCAAVESVQSGQAVQIIDVTAKECIP